MKRMLVGLLALSFPYAVQAAEIDRHVDIGDSRALDAIQAANPAQYEKVIGILQKVAGSVSCETLPQMLKVQYGAEQVRCAGHAILTSYPAKRHLSFKLDDVYFVGNVALTGEPGKLLPAQ
ncbi:MAG TPA: hypothetical protein VLH12_07740 [Usitatibacter sp.]|nr:hypothetical protein [Usitatibacter sp.]